MHIHHINHPHVLLLPYNRNKFQEYKREKANYSIRSSAAEVDTSSYSSESNKKEDTVRW